jgi:hypothetical protein
MCTCIHTNTYTHTRTHTHTHTHTRARARAHTQASREVQDLQSRLSDVIGRNSDLEIGSKESMLVGWLEGGCEVWGLGFRGGARS